MNIVLFIVSILFTLSVFIISKLVSKKSASYKEFAKFSDSMKNQISNSVIDVYRDRVLDEISDFDNDITEKIKEFNTQYGFYLKELQVGFDDLNDKFSNKMKSIEREFFSKNEDSLLKQSKMIEEYAGKFNKLASDVETFSDKFNNDVVVKNDQVKKEINNILENGLNNIKVSYNDFKKDAELTISMYNNTISELKESIMNINDKYDHNLIEKFDNIDNQFDVKMNLLEEKFKLRVRELYDKTSSVELDFSKRLDIIRDDYYKKNEKIVADNIERLNDYSKRFNELNELVKSHKSKIDVDVAKKIEEAKITLREQYKTLETDTIEKIDRYKNDLIKLKESMSKDSEAFSISMGEKINSCEIWFNAKKEETIKKYDEFLIDSNKRIEQYESDFMKRFEGLVKSNEELNKSNISAIEENKNSIKEISSYMENIKEIVKEEVMGLIDVGLASVRNNMGSELEKINEIFKNIDFETNSKIEAYTKELYKVQQNIKETDEKMTQKYGENYTAIEKRIKVVEDNLKKLERTDSVIESINVQKEKLLVEFKRIRDDIQSIKVYRNDIDNVEKDVKKISALFTEMNERYKNIINDKKRIDNTELMLKELREISNSIEDKLENIKNGKVAINNLEDKIVIVNQKFKDLDTYFDKIALKEKDIKNIVLDIDKSQEYLSGINKRLDATIKRLDDVDYKRDVYEKGFKSLEKNLSTLTNSEEKIDLVINKFSQMDNLIEDLDNRTESISKMREWLFKTEARLSSLNEESEKKIKVMDGLINKNNSSSSNKKDNVVDDGSKKSVILQLKSQGWTIDEIARSIGLSVGEVEFILDFDIARKK